MPFYQPLIALEIFERAISGLDIATGSQKVTEDYMTVGPSESTYREGNSTIQFSVVNTNATYNVTTNGPNPSYQAFSKEYLKKREVGSWNHKAQLPMKC